MRSDATRELTKDAAALGLMAVIALRARWRTGFDTQGLEVGQALIGDHENIGLTRQEYRTRVNRLEKWGLIATKATSRGTIATISSGAVFEVFSGKHNHRGNQPTTNRQPANHQPATTNEEGKKDRKKKTQRLSSDPRFAPVEAGFYREYETAFGVGYAPVGNKDGVALVELLSILDPDNYPTEKIIQVARAAMTRSKDRFARECKRASTLQGFCCAFNEIRAELSRVVVADGHTGVARPAGAWTRPTGQEIRAWLCEAASSCPQYNSKLEEWQCWDDLPQTAKRELLAWRQTINPAPQPAHALPPDLPQKNLPPSTANKNFAAQI